MEMTATTYNQRGYFFIDEMSERNSQMYLTISERMSLYLQYKRMDLY